MSFIEKIKDRIQGKAPKGAKRSPQWRKVREEHLKKFPTCYVCGSNKKITVHHIYPYHLFPDMELEESNLITLCEGGRFKSLNCHIVFGHCCDFKDVNTQCEIDAEIWRRKLND